MLEGQLSIQRRLTQGKLLAFFAKQAPCLVGMEACAAAHHWGRELQKLGQHGATNAAQLCKALCEAAEERCR